MDDETLAKSFHKKYYADMDYKEFSSKFIGESESAYQKYVPNPIKNAVGGIESVARMAWNAPAGAVAKGVGALTGLASGEDMGLALQRGDEAAHRVSIDPLTKQGELADQMLGEGYEKLYREPFGNLGAEDLRYDPNAKSGPRADPKQEAKARSAYEAVADALGFAGLIRGGLKMGKGTARPKETGIREVQQETPAKVWEQVDQAHAPMEGTVRAPQYGMGEVPSYIERDMFGQPEIRPPVVEPRPGGMEAIPDAFKAPAKVELTPEQVKGGYERPANDVRRITEDGLPPGTIK